MLHPVSGDVDPFELCDVEVQPRNNVTQGPNSQPTHLCTIIARGMPKFLFSKTRPALRCCRIVV